VKFCLWCEEEILPDEVMPHAPLTQMHRECVLRNVLGSVGHHRRTCSCHLSTGGEGDPLGMGKRDAARLALVEFMAQSEHTPLHGWPARLRATLRPSNFGELSTEEQWRIDKALRLLDWDGVSN
jgi:hypothetical protein